jgi:hypothetical protein
MLVPVETRAGNVVCVVLGVGRGGGGKFEYIVLSWSVRGDWFVDANWMVYKYCFARCGTKPTVARTLRLTMPLYLPRSTPTPCPNTAQIPAHEHDKHRGIGRCSSEDLVAFRIRQYPDTHCEKHGPATDHAQGCRGILHEIQRRGGAEKEEECERC